MKAYQTNIFDFIKPKKSIKKNQMHTQNKSVNTIKSKKAFPSFQQHTSTYRPKSPLAKDKAKSINKQAKPQVNNKALQHSQVNLKALGFKPAKGKVAKKMHIMHLGIER